LQSVDGNRADIAADDGRRPDNGPRDRTHECTCRARFGSNNPSRSRSDGGFLVGRLE